LDARNCAKVESKEMDKVAIEWREDGINVYEGDPGRPVCQCHTTHDAERIVEAVNKAGRVGFKPKTQRDQASEWTWVPLIAIATGVVMGAWACRIWFAH